MIFRKIILGFVRKSNPSIPYISDAKRYGNSKEQAFAYFLPKELPNCKIKQNVLIHTAEGNAEIDCLVLHQNKLFAIEVKGWKGELTGNDDEIVQHKIDRWTDEVHTKYHKSPFRQLNRAVHLLRKQIPGRVWVNPIVYFDGADSVDIQSTHDWVTTMEELVDYMNAQGEISYEDNAEKFFEKCIAADVLYARSGYRTFRCRISDKSLRFRIDNRLVTRKEIVQIRIRHHWSYDTRHHWSYDTLYIKTRYGEELRVKLENEKLEIMDNGERCVYALSKLDWICLG